MNIQIWILLKVQHVTFCVRERLGAGQRDDEGEKLEKSSDTAVQEEKTDAHDTDRKYSSRRKEKFNSMFEPTTRCQINSDMSERQIQRDKQDMICISSFELLSLMLIDK